VELATVDLKLLDAQQLVNDLQTGRLNDPAMAYTAVSIAREALDAAEREGLKIGKRREVLRLMGLDILRATYS
jgi:hypothetical protein